MKKLFRWLVIGIVVLVALAGAVAAAAHLMSERKRNRVVAVDVKPVAFTSDPAALERGKYLFASRGCGDCHGKDGAGRAFIDEPGGLYVRAPNITPAGVVKDYREVDWVRSIRHGVKPDGRPLLIMPCEDYNRFTDVDLAALVAYARSLPAAAGEGAVFRLPLPLKAAYALGAVKDAPEKINHALPPEKPVAEGVTVEHGRYVANMCIGCHGPRLSGGKIPGGPPGWPPASNLTPGIGSILPLYDSVEKFKAMFRSGKRPGGSAVAVMPFETLREMNDVDVEALYLYLKSLPPRAAGER